MSIGQIIVGTVGAVAAVILTLPLVLLLLPFWLVAVTTRFLARLAAPVTVGWEDVIRFDAQFGWRPKSNLDVHCHFEAGTFHVRTDREGWPGKVSLTESDAVVFGDSYVFGYGVNCDALFSELPSKVRIKAIGAPGYNMVQELLLMQRYSAQLAGKLVVWCVYFGNDLYDNLLPNLYQYRMPFVRQSGHSASSWEIETSHLRPDPWPFSHESNARVKEKLKGTFGGNEQGERTFSACEYLLAQGRDVCEQAGAQLVVLSVPWLIQLDSSVWRRRWSSIGEDASSYDPLHPNRRLAEACANLGLQFVDGSRHLGLRDYFPGEGHWNERGHRRVQRLVASLHEEMVTGGLRSSMSLRDAATPVVATQVEMTSDV